MRSERDTPRSIISGEASTVDEATLRERLAVYLVADPEATSRPLLDDVQAALDGGATCVQLRAKRLDGYDLWRLATTMKFLCAQFGALFFVNDRLDVALAAGADGVHLGTSDLPPDVARTLTPPGFLIGFSPKTLDDVTATARLGADYAGLGPVFPTGSKADAQSPIGLDGLRAQVAACRVPTVGIGGITIANAPEVIGAGADGVAVISAILGTEDPAAATEALAREVNTALAAR
ncbi:MAG: thiamine phosphate synthase [Thermomicrobiales bacterium]|nr:thiamine phosphate synthase [Thermomicrobiales bacterium]